MKFKPTFGGFEEAKSGGDDFLGGFAGYSFGQFGGADEEGLEESYLAG